MQQRENFQQACSDAIAVGMMVITKYNYKAYKGDRIDYNANNTSSTFETKKGPKTYVNYYHQRYDMTISNLYQPMLVSEPKMRHIRRGQVGVVGNIYLAPEFSKIPCGLTDELY
ncbi:unnamed protein product [Orchesella dallaii]|uniref:PAZ domain-containing protein n=1 Tax=Orchesella dallaii TaxID=48710 RepID=A0ABP1PKT2_9HEXA